MKVFVMRKVYEMADNEKIINEMINDIGKNRGYIFFLYVVIILMAVWVLLNV